MNSERLTAMLDGAREDWDAYVYRQRGPKRAYAERYGEFRFGTGALPNEDGIGRIAAARVRDRAEDVYRHWWTLYIGPSR